MAHLAHSHRLLPAEEFFPRAAFYALGHEAGAGEVREKSAKAKAFTWTERHLQCVWFDAALRPTSLRTHDGEEVMIEDPGVWNLEAGPDFLGAALRIGSGRRRITGDVEIHIHPADWRNHGHGKDPRYERVRAHVTYFPGQLPADDLPPGTVQIALKDALAANPVFSFANIDLPAYPYAARAQVPPCLTELKRWTADAKENLLDAAGEERMRRKAERLALDVEQKGRDQVLYEEVLCALGYKHNKTPFRQLAGQVPLDVLRDEADSNVLAAYALLLGVSGLLPDSISTRWDGATRAFIRTIWDEWWKRRDAFAGRVLPRTAWRLAGLRPANHPVRRLMAAAYLFSRPQSLAERWLDLAARHPESCNEKLVDLLQSATGTYWDRRLGLAGKAAGKPVALLGRDLANVMLLNVFIPFLAAVGEARPFRQGLLKHVPAESDNAVIRQTAFNLFGADHSESLYRTGLRRQGLVQIFHDYCLNDRSRCASCTFLELLRKHGSHA